MRRGPIARTRREAREIAADLSATLDCYVWAEEGMVFVDSTNYDRAMEARKMQNKYLYNPRIRLCKCD
jgi:hypothetical protein